MASSPRKSPLQQMELDILAEGREWMRKRLEERMREAGLQAETPSPPEPFAAPQDSLAPNQPHELRGRGKRRRPLRPGS